MSWYRRAQEEEEDLLGDTVEEMLAPSPGQVKTKSCETSYSAGGEVLKLWVIGGGGAAELAFDDYSFMERYPVSDPRWQEEWDREREAYPHQDTSRMQGPTYDILPEGKWTVMKFLNKYLPLKRLRDERKAALPARGTIHSRTRVDREGHARFRFEADPYRLGPVTVNGGNVYGGRMDKMVMDPKWDPWWTSYAKFINPIFDANTSHGLEALTDDQFRQMVTMLNEGLASGAIQGGR